MAVFSPLLILTCWVSSLVVFGWCREETCLQDGRHKDSPSPEFSLRECSLYMEYACCSEQNIEDLTVPPAAVHWDRCGSLSPVCDSFLKRVVCFYRCSPDAARWIDPQHGSALRAVPLCHSFCRDWYKACKSDLTCARDWTSDPRGLNCTGSCVPYQQMYQHGRDLCESLCGDVFMTVEDNAEEIEGGCLTLSASDHRVIAALKAGKNPNMLDTIRCGQNCPGCSHSPAAVAQKSNNNPVFRKRSVPVHDSEGSGSGF
ncbi:retbindin [Trichomycterus rosablanca]|uniref:retbindin n=1 Tax=Trichomycterus rosablanca TaxID=2290929 RepID=UPI002F34EFF2